MRKLRQQKSGIKGLLCGVVASALCIALCVCYASSSPETASFPSSSTASAGLVSIKIIHTNDIHGRSAYQKDSVVGFERLAALIGQEKPALVLDIGDTFHGQAFATLEQGASMAELLKAAKYDAMTPGNHDWNYGKERLKELEQLSGIPLLAANVTEADSAFFANDGTFLKTVNGVKIGVLGVFDPGLQTSTAPRNVQGITFGDDAQKASELAGKLRSCSRTSLIARNLSAESVALTSCSLDMNTL